MVHFSLYSFLPQTSVLSANKLLEQILQKFNCLQTYLNLKVSSRIYEKERKRIFFFFVGERCDRMVQKATFHVIGNPEGKGWFPPRLSSDLKSSILTCSIMMCIWDYTTFPAISFLVYSVLYSVTSQCRLRKYEKHKLQYRFFISLLMHAIKTPVRNLLSAWKQGGKRLSHCMKIFEITLSLLPSHIIVHHVKNINNNNNPLEVERNRKVRKVKERNLHSSMTQNL